MRKTKALGENNNNNNSNNSIPKIRVNDRAGMRKNILTDVKIKK